MIYNKNNMRMINVPSSWLRYILPNLKQNITCRLGDTLIIPETLIPSLIDKVPIDEWISYLTHMQYQ